MNTNLQILVVTLTLVSTTWQAPMTSGGDSDLQQMMMQYLTQQQQGQQQQPQPEQYNPQPEQYSEEAMKKMVEKYLQGLGAGDMAGDDSDMMRVMMTRYMEAQKKMKKEQTMEGGEAMAWSMNAMVKHYIANKDGGDDTMKSFILAALQQYSSGNEATDQQKMMYGLLMHVMSKPELGKDSLVQKLLMHAMSEQGLEDHRFMAVLFTHMLSKRTGDEAELVKTLLHNVLTQDTFETGHGKQLLLLLLQHYMAKEGGSDKDAIGLLMLQTLSRNNDPTSNALLRKLVYHMITSGGDDKKKPMDQAEQYFWKWLPPTPCRIENNDNQIMYQESCPNNMQCSTGPHTMQVNSTTMRITLCSLPSEYLLYHACQVTNAAGTVVKFQGCPSNYGQCSMGPFRVQVNDSDGSAMFCTGLATNYLQPKTIVDRACRIQDRYHYYPLQRRCPYGYSCDAGPFNTTWNDGEKVHAYVCYPKEDDKKQGDFMSEVLSTLLGMPDMSMMMGMEGQNMSSGGNGMEQQGNDQFLKFLLQHMMENAEKSKDQEQAENPMNDKDHVGLLILKHFVMEMKEENGEEGVKAVAKILEHMIEKKKKYGLDEGDRKMMNMLILHFVHMKKKAASAQEMAKEKAGKEAQMMKMMLQHLMEASQQEGGDMMEMLKKLLEHASEQMQQGGGEMGQGEQEDGNMLAMLVKHVLSQAQPNQQSSDGYRQLIMMLIQHSMKENEKQQDMEEKQREFMMSMLKHIMSQNEQSTEDNDHMEALKKLLEHVMQQREENKGKDLLQSLYEHMMAENQKEKSGEAEEEMKKQKMKMMMKLLHHALEERLGMPEGQGEMQQGEEEGGDMAKLMMLLKHAQAHKKMEKMESHLDYLKKMMEEASGKKEEMQGNDMQAKAMMKLLKMLMNE